MATLKSINSHLQDCGLPYTLNKGKGYFYVTGADTSTWKTTSILVPKLNDLDSFGWRDAVESLKKENGINEDDLAEFTATLPEHVRKEHYRWLNTTYSIPKALYLAKDLELGSVDVKVWAKSLAIDMPLRSGPFPMSILSHADDTKALSDAVKLGPPLIILVHSFLYEGKTETATILIDGHHRLRRAFLEGVLKLDAILIPAELAEKVKS